MAYQSMASKYMYQGSISYIGANSYEAYIISYKASKLHLNINSSTCYPGHHFGARINIATEGKHDKRMHRI